MISQPIISAVITGSLLSGLKELTVEKLDEVDMVAIHCSTLSQQCSVDNQRRIITGMGPVEKSDVHLVSIAENILHVPSLSPTVVLDWKRISLWEVARFLRGGNVDAFEMLTSPLRQDHETFGESMIELRQAILPKFVTKEVIKKCGVGAGGILKQLHKSSTFLHAKQEEMVRVPFKEVKIVCFGLRFALQALQMGVVGRTPSFEVHALLPVLEVALCAPDVDLLKNLVAHRVARTDCVLPPGVGMLQLEAMVSTMVRKSQSTLVYASLPDSPSEEALALLDGWLLNVAQNAEKTYCTKNAKKNNFKTVTIVHVKNIFAHPNRESPLVASGYFL